MPILERRIDRINKGLISHNKQKYSLTVEKLRLHQLFGWLALAWPGWQSGISWPD